MGLEISLPQFVCVAAMAVFLTYRAGTHGFVSSPYLPYAVALGVPAFAWVLLIVACLAVPSLLAPGRLTFPLFVTMPIVYTGLLVLVHALVTRSGSSLTAPSDRLLPAMIWGQPFILAVGFVLQVFALLGKYRIDLRGMGE